MVAPIYMTTSDGTNPDWSSYKSKYAFFKKYKKYCKYVQNDTDSNDYVVIYKI
jgi:hypothetical protein